MRWALKTKTEDITSAQDSSLLSTQTKRKTITTKTQYITVGDIVGAASSMAGAVKNVVRTIPGYINIFRNNGDFASASLAQVALNIATPLAGIIQGAEVYKTLMNVVNTLTPIMKLIARGTGVWCSPGNAADIANIILGTVQQILVAVVTQIIIALKDWVWNFEFKLRDITTESSIIITRNLKSSSARINKKVYSSLNYSTLNQGLDVQSLSAISGGHLAPTGSQTELSKLIKQINEQAGISATLAGQAEEIRKAIIAGLHPAFGDSWITEYNMDGEHLREFRGSSNNSGIQYSTIENGKVIWKQSNKTDGSFCSFGKINKSDGTVIYLAGSAPWVYKTDLTLNTDSEWRQDTHGMYNKDYYIYDSVKDAERKNNNFHKAGKALKDSVDIDTQTKKRAVRCYEAITPTADAIGIWYSTDNGENWYQSNITDGYIGLFFEYTEKPDYPTTSVAARYDYQGLLYSEDGSHWEVSKVGEGEDLDFGRFIDLKDLKSEKFRVNSTDIEATATITATVYTLTHHNLNQETNVSISPLGITVNNEETINKVRKILDYIHYNYNSYNGDVYYLRKFDDAFWTQLIKDIKSNDYTMANAIKGDRIIE
jgi:hypothetical protein